MVSRTRFAVNAVLILLVAAPSLAQFDQTEVSATSAAPFYMVRGSGSFEDFSAQGARAYNIYRRQPGDGFRCLVPDLPGNSWPGGDPQWPVRDVWWYTVNGFDGATENRHGSSVAIVQPCHSAGPPIPVRVNACMSLINAGQPSTITIEIDNRGGTSDLTGCTLDDDVEGGGCMNLIDCGAVTPPIAGIACDAVLGTVRATGFTVAAGTRQRIDLNVVGGAATATCLNAARVVCASRQGTGSGVLNVLLPSCTPVAGRPALRVVPAGTGFTRPVHLAAPPLDTARLFVVEQAGRIRIVRGGTVLATAFLDIRPLVLSTGNEQGLLSLAFHPNYANNGRFFVFYTAVRGGGGSVLTVVEYRVSAADPDVADSTSARIVITIDHPTNTNHNGGQVAFSPCDGYLYVGTGDGGSGDDPPDNAENLRSGLGKLLRIDVDGDCSPAAYCVPPDNPFLLNPGALPELWAFGLRNPWRFAFDREKGDLYIGDVGQGRMEEIDVQPVSSGGGETYGWDSMEGSLCHEIPGCPAGTTAPAPVGVLPVAEYPRSQGSSVTGGQVYRGCRLPGYSGTYFYADYGAGNFVRSFEYAGGVATNPLSWPAFTAAGLVRSASSFGEDGAGEVYILNLGGAIFRISD